MKTSKLAKSYRIDDGKHFQLKILIPRTPGMYIPPTRPRNNCRKTFPAWRTYRLSFTRKIDGRFC